jgi:hypothetical protein
MPDTICTARDNSAFECSTISSLTGLGFERNAKPNQKNGLGRLIIQWTKYHQFFECCRFVEAVQPLSASGH